MSLPLTWAELICNLPWRKQNYIWLAPSTHSLAMPGRHLVRIGLFLPLLTVPDSRHCTGDFAWENRYAKGDFLASTLVRAVGIVAAYLECRIHVRHVRG
jgi:hypothetical protein